MHADDQRSDVVRTLIMMITLLALPSGSAWGQNAEQSPPNPGAGKKLCLCEVRSRGTSAAGNVGGLIGGAAGGTIAGASAGDTYSGEFQAEVQQVFEAALSQSKLFQYVARSTIVTKKSGKNLSLAQIAQENQLQWCVKASTFSGAAFGFKKKALFVAKWELVSPDGGKIKIDTTADSRETYGEFPNGADPMLKPVYLGLARENVQQFLDKLSRKLSM